MCRESTHAPALHTPDPQDSVQAAGQQHVVVWVKCQAGQACLAAILDALERLLWLVQFVHVIQADAAVKPATSAAQTCGTHPAGHWVACAVQFCTCWHAGVRACLLHIHKDGSNDQLAPDIRCCSYLRPTTSVSTAQQPTHPAVKIFPLSAMTMHFTTSV